MPSSYAYMYIYVMYTLHVIYMNKPPDSLNLIGRQMGCGPSRHLSL